MQEKNSNSQDSIKAILDEMSQGKDDSSIDDAEKKSGLDFSYTEDPEPEREVRVEFKTETKQKKKTEIHVPEKFTAGPKYNSKPETKRVQGISVTYVPRFTGIGDNYRMADEPRKTAFHKALKKAPAESATAEYKEDIDPIAEIDQDVSDNAVQVKSGKAEIPESESSSKVFKFEVNTPQNSAPAKEERVAEEDQLPTEEPQISEEQPETIDVDEYRIPDPMDLPAELENTVFTSIVANSVLEDCPEGTVADYDGKKTKEYISYAQRDSIKDRFIDTVISIYVRFFAMLVLAVIVACSECAFAMGADIPDILGLSAVPGAMGLLDFQFVICIYLLALPETVAAFRNLIHRKLTPELFLTVCFVVLAIYTVVITAQAPAQYALFGLIFAVYSIASVGASFFKTSADFTAFKRASKNGEKTVIDNAYTRNLERENAALDGVVEEHKSKTARTFRALFVSDFFKRTAVCEENRYNILMILGVSFGASIVVGAVALFIPGGWVSAITGFALTFMLSCPAASILIRKVPYFHASREAEGEKSSIIGERSLSEYSGVDVITFEDTEVFGEEDVTLQRIMLYGNSENLTKALRQSSAVFMNVGGPLDVLFSNSLDRKCAPAGSPCVEKGGASGVVDGHQVVAGTIDYILSKGARLPAEENFAHEKINNSTKVVFIAEDGAVYAKFYIRYSFSEDFTMLLPVLEDAKIIPLVYTRDPNVTPELINTLTAGSGKIKIIRRSDVRSGEVIYRRASAGIVTHGDKSNAINMILLSKKYEILQSRLSIAELVAMTAGAVLAAVLSITGATAIPALVFAGVQAVLCGALYLSSIICFRFSKRKKQ